MSQISIIVPVYKTEKYLSICIESIINQTFQDWELILVDDGSPDNCGDICDEYANKDKRIKVLHKNNEGVGSARNAGLKMVSGEYVAFVDSDDFCDKEYLKNFETGIVNQMDLVIQGYMEYINGAKPGKMFNSRIYENNLVDALIDNELLTFGAPYCKLFKRSVIENNDIRFSTKYSYGEDTCFFFNYCKFINNIKLVSNVGYYYRCELSNSLSMKNHDFFDLIAFANESLSLLRQIDANNKLEIAYSSSYIKLHIRAIKNMFRLDYPKDKRIACIGSIKRNVIKQEKGFSTLKNLYYIMLFFPSFIVDYIFNINYKLNK